MSNKEIERITDEMVKQMLAKSDLELEGIAAAVELAEECRPAPANISPAVHQELARRAEKSRQLRAMLRVNPYQGVN